MKLANPAKKINSVMNKKLPCSLSVFEIKVRRRIFGLTEVGTRCMHGNGERCVQDVLGGNGLSKWTVGKVHYE